MNRRTGLGVAWHLPEADAGGYRARTFADTTRATSDLIEMLAADTGGTWALLHDRINYDDDARAVCQGFMEAGFGDRQAADDLGLRNSTLRR